MQRAPVRIRKAHLPDAPAIARVMRSAIRGLAAGTCTARELAAWSSLPALYHAWAMTSGGEAYLVAEEGARVVGYAARRGGEVTAAFVAPARARAGVGAALLARLEEDAGRAGIRSLFVLAAPGAVPFYEALGYRGGRRVRVPLPGGVHLPARRLAKRLTRTARRRRASPP
jgi:GNAT superfamily N-acetyltransferase